MGKVVAQAIMSLDGYVAKQDNTIGHPEAPFTFVTDGVAAAVAHAQSLAGDRVVAVTGG